ncbi:hypothetical protein [Anaeromicropila herbilytica]|uniref:Uncharacterized protein n=1 Tax=Anaeromicropila herbilytica TaxID=2785025 RepID=A0A7R7IE65_9FIRM|nr:hypothetical protein [Anaeromicropila herbilytica]BCN31789.1 hypothetical protein bsdtb5_30840 [Anaeromicropila herbilytica]
MRTKIRQFIHDILKCLLGGLGISFIVSVFAIIGSIITTRSLITSGSLPVILMLIRGTLLATGAIILLLGAFMWLKNNFLKSGVRYNQIRRLYQNMDSQMDDSFLSKEGSMSVLRGEFWIFSYRDIFICVGVIVILMGCFIDWVEIISM